MATKNKKENYRWGRGEPRRFENFACDGLAIFFERHASIQTQTEFKRQRRQVDMIVHGSYGKHGLPPCVAKDAVDRLVLIELESRALTLPRFRLMSEELMAAYTRYGDRNGWKPPEEEPQRMPMLVVFARSVHAKLQPELQPTADPGVFYSHHLGLTLYVVDNTRVPSDSCYCHLKALHGPPDMPIEDMKAMIVEQNRQIIQHSNAPRAILEDLIMTNTRTIFHDRVSQEGVFHFSLDDAFNAGVEQGRKENVSGFGLEEAYNDGVRNAADVCRKGIQELAKRRGIRLTANSLARLNACEDLEQLMQWNLQVAMADNSTVELEE